MLLYAIIVSFILFTHNEVLLKLFGSNYSPFALFISAFSFTSVTLRKHFSNKYINIFASGALAAYIISETAPMKAFLLNILGHLDYNVAVLLMFSLIIYSMSFIIDRILSPFEKYINKIIFNGIYKCKNFKPLNLL